MTGRATIETAWTAEPLVPTSRSLRSLQRAVELVEDLRCAQRLALADG